MGNSDTELFQQLFDTVAEMQGQLMACSAMLEATIMAHPDPDALRRQWNRVSAVRLADASLRVVTKNRAADHAYEWHLKNWSEKLDRHFPRPVPGASPPET